jgi:pyruvate dehydrogenase E2 component (dihydrolipoamide acetyltransferase)
MAVPVIMPRQGQSVETCLFSAWHVKKGDQVTKGDLLFSYETDKAAFDAEAPADGVVLETFASPGDVIPVLENIAVIGNPGESIDEFKPGRIPDAAAVNSPIMTESTHEENIIKEIPSAIGEIRISPRAKKAAAGLRISVKGIKGSGPEGRIIEQDILNRAKEIPRATPLARSIAYSDQLDLPASGSGKDGKIISSDLKEKHAESLNSEFEEKPLTNVRRIIAQKMHESLQQTAQLTLHSSADARRILDLRKTFKSAAEKTGGVNITLNDLVCFAIVKALKKSPGINAHFLGNAIRYYHPVHLGFAVDTPRGLIVPTLQNADRLPLEKFASSLKELALRAQQGNIDPELLSGATFTVTNLGSLGVEMFTPVLNPPQVGIMGINAIRYQPDDIGGIIGFIPKIGLSLTFDHRAIDGAPAAVFLQETVKQILDFETN